MAAVEARPNVDLRKSGAGPIQWVEDRMKRLHAVLFDGDTRTAQLQAIQTNTAKKQKDFDRTVQFWTRSAHIYASYKTTQLRVQFVKDEAERERIWEEQHEKAADRVYALCYDLKGFFLKTAQLLAKPDLVPLAWVKKLVDLCDKAPQTPFDQVQRVITDEMGRPFEELFERFDIKPLGSASVAQVHKARLIGANSDVAVKVQHPGAHELMMTDIRNQKVFARILQKTDLKFDLVSIMDELEEQVEYEFDFQREALSMDKIGNNLDKFNKKKKVPVIVPRSIPGMVTRKVLVMDFIAGTPIMELGDQLEKRGINPNGRLAKMAKTNILRDLSAAYGQMILRDGFFQADPHPGNVLIKDNGKVALIDYGQTKLLNDNLKLGFASVVVGLANNDANQITKAFSDLKIGATSKSNNPEDTKILARLMFDTKLPDGWIAASPFGDDSILQAISVENFPKELFFILRTAQLLRGLSVGMEVPFSSSEQWKPLAEAALRSAKSATYEAEFEKGQSRPRLLYWQRRKRQRKLGPIPAAA